MSVFVSETSCVLSVDSVSPSDGTSGDPAWFGDLLPFSVCEHASFLLFLKNKLVKNQINQDAMMPWKPKYDDSLSGTH